MPIIGSPTAPSTPINTRVLTLLGSDAKLTTTEIDILIEARYEHMYETFDWAQRERVAYLTSSLGIVSSTASTLATVTNDSHIVTFAGTPILASYEGKQIRLGDEQTYFFIKYVGTGTIHLYSDRDLTNVATWARASGGSQSWTIFQSVFDVAQDMAHILTITGQFELRPFEGGFEHLNRYDAYRLSTADHPTHWVYYHFPHEPTNVNRRIELWPVPSSQRILKAVYLKAATTGSLTDNYDLPYPPLTYYAAADACHLLHAKQGSRENMWEQKAIFFERLAGEMLRDYKADAIERRQPPTQLGRDLGSPRLRGTDFEITHDLNLLP